MKAALYDDHVRAAGGVARAFLREIGIEVWSFTAAKQKNVAGMKRPVDGAGDTWTPTMINLFVFWLWELPLAYVLAIWFGLGPRGVFLAITIAFSTLAVVSAYFFKRGRWKTRVV